MKLNVGVVIDITTCEIVFKSERTSHKTDTEHVLKFDSTRSESGVMRKFFKPLSKVFKPFHVFHSDQTVPFLAILSPFKL